MEFRPTNKHLFTASVSGIIVVAVLCYMGMSNPGRYFYEGSYNTHDPGFVNNNPDSPHSISYGEDCNACHKVGFEPVSADTCMTSGCHNALDPTKAGRQEVVVKFNPVSYGYHQVVKSHDCGECHRIHEFRKVETEWFGRGFRHQDLVPSWNDNHSCKQCHAKFDNVESVLEIMKEVPAFERQSNSDLRDRASEWLSRTALEQIERESLGLSDKQALPREYELSPYSVKAVDDARAEGREALLYFRTEGAREDGGICRYLEDELFAIGPVSDALANYAIYTVDFATDPEAWNEFGAFRAGTLLRYRKDGSRDRLDFFTSPSDIVVFLTRAH